jgi:hypothetical protein
MLWASILLVRLDDETCACPRNLIGCTVMLLLHRGWFVGFALAFLFEAAPSVERRERHMKSFESSGTWLDRGCPSRTKSSSMLQPCEAESAATISHRHRTNATALASRHRSLPRGCICTEHCGHATSCCAPNLPPLRCPGKCLVTATYV